MSKPYNPKDAFYRRAREGDLRARSAFKIDEILQRFRLVARGDTVLDLGAAPGGFLKILEAQVGPTGQVVGVDLAAIRPLGPTVTTLVHDVLAPTLEGAVAAVLRGPVDLVASDLAPKTSGIRDQDEARSLALVGRALDLAGRFAKPESHFVAKVFMGGDFEAFFSRVKAAYADSRVVRPEATRARSREVYVVAQRRKVTPRTGAGG